METQSFQQGSSRRCKTDCRQRTEDNFFKKKKREGFINSQQQQREKERGGEDERENENKNKKEKENENCSKPNKHLKGQDPKSPPIHCLSMSFTLNDFWSKIFGRSTQRPSSF
jgi:hypothetical protein